jgi:hypothetical protein
MISTAAIGRRLRWLRLRGKYFTPQVFRGLLFASTLALLALAPTGVRNAGAQSLTEEQLRARFLVNFLRFTKWPDAAFASPGAPVGLCILGGGNHSMFVSALAEFQGISVAGRKLAIRDDVDERQLADCHLLYVLDDSLPRLASARAAAGKHPLLIVGESEAVLDRGGMIALRDDNRHLAFVVRLEPAQRAGLRFESQMLNVAAEVLH